MKHKKTLLALVASLGFLFAAGCGGNAPEDVAKDYLDALVAGDVKKANSLSTERTAAANGLLISMIEQQKKQNPDAVKEIGKVKEVKIDGDKAKVYFEGDGNALDLVKVDGEWKADVRKS